jgi:hypothetical protein
MDWKIGWSRTRQRRQKGRKAKKRKEQYERKKGMSREGTETGKEKVIKLVK